MSNSSFRYLSKRNCSFVCSCPLCFYFKEKQRNPFHIDIKHVVLEPETDNGFVSILECIFGVATETELIEHRILYGNIFTMAVSQRLFTNGLEINYKVVICNSNKNRRCMMTL